jgi:hypothetical protein
VVPDDDDPGGRGGLATHALGDPDDLPGGRLQGVTAGTERVRRFAAVQVGTDAGECLADGRGDPVVAGVDVDGAAVVDGRRPEEGDRVAGVGHGPPADVTLGRGKATLAGGPAGATVPLGPGVTAAEGHLPVGRDRPDRRVAVGRDLEQSAVHRTVRRRRGPSPADDQGGVGRRLARARTRSAVAVHRRPCGPDAFSICARRPERGRERDATRGP